MKSLDNLNIKQKEAASQIDGPVLIIAGAGSGKTRVITSKIAHMIESGINPQNILALTFTDKAASEMSERVDELLPSTDSPTISTFHSFSKEILEENVFSAGLNPDFKLIDETSQLVFFSKNMRDWNLKTIDVSHNLTGTSIEIKKILSKFKDENITPDKIKKYIQGFNDISLTEDEQNELDGLNDVRICYKNYESYKKENNLIDFGDMLFLVHKIFSEKPKILEEYQDRYKYILVDEFQDTNYIQLMVLNLLARKHKNITIVGDDDQCLPSDTKIHTKNGIKKIKDVKIGEEVLTAVGKGHLSFNKVLNKSVNSKKVRYLTIKTKSGNKLKLTDNHKIFCRTPPSKKSKYWYVYLMEKQNVGWRIGITNSLGNRLKLERAADRIIAIRSFETEKDARYHETLWSLKYGIPTYCFSLTRKGLILDNQLLSELHESLDIEKNVKRLANDLNIDLNSHHYAVGAVNRGQSNRIKIYLDMCYRNMCYRRYKSKTKEILKNPKVLHQLSIETSDKNIIKILNNNGYILSKARKGYRLRIQNSDITELGKHSKIIKNLTNGILENRFLVGKSNIQHKPSLIIPAKNIQLGLQIPIIKENEVIYDEVISIKEDVTQDTVYDLEIDRTHNFIANGMVVHNSIYKFRGAHSNNIEDFKKLYPDHKEIILEENYRCSKPILSLANDIIKNKPRGTVKKLIAKKDHDEKVRALEFAKDQDQYNFITKEILDLSKKRSLKDIAVLVRRKKDAEPLIDTFDKHGINYEFVGEVSFFDEPIIKDILAYLRFLENPIEEDTSLHRILSRDVYWLRKVEIARLGKFAREKRKSLFEAFDHLNEIRNIDKHKFEYVKNELVDLLDIRDKVNVLELTRKIIYETGFRSYEVSLGNMRNVKLIEHFDKFVSNFKRINEGSHLKELLEYIDLASGFEIDTYDEDDSNDVVRILTIHASKGKEFPVVFIPDLVENRLPTRYREDKYVVPKGLLNNNNLDNKSDHINEERRLLYVAVTRAMESLYLTYARRYGDNKRDSKISRFLNEIRYVGHGSIEYKKPRIEPLSIEETSTKGRIKERYIKSIVSDLKTGFYTKTIPKILLLQKLDNEGGNPLEILDEAKKFDYEKMLEFAKSNPAEEGIDEDHKFSATQFNTYKKCPRQYQFSNVYNIKGRTSHYLELGLSVHKTVESISELLKNGEKVDIKKASEILKEKWIATSYETKDHELQNYKEAKEMIENFLEGQNEMRTEIHELEKPFSIELNGQRVSGSIDRVDKEGDDFILIDYKTSKTQESDSQVRQNLQLLLYSMACEKIYGKYPKKVGLWYLRTNKRVMVDVDPDTIDSLKQELTDIMKRIKNGEFNPSPGWHCKSCDYSNICDAKKS